MSYYFHEKSAFVAIITQAAQELAQKIRQYSKRQVKLWQQVPSWALEADGRTGYSGLLSKAYTERLWTLGIGSLGIGSLYIDLKTGEFIKVILGNRYLLSSEDDELILSLALKLEKLEEIDASKILQRLKEQSKINASGISNIMSQEHRDKLRRQLGLEAVAI